MTKEPEGNALNRRGMLRMAGLTGLGMGLAACGRGFGGGDDARGGGAVQLNMVWWGWGELAAFARDITKASGGKVYGTAFEPATLANIIVFTRQRGEDFYTEDGALGISEATVVAWFEIVNAMRAEGGFPPAGFIESVGGSAEQSYLAKGSIASQIIPTNNFLAYNAAAGGNLALLRIPGETQGSRRGQSVDCPHLWSIAAQSKHRDEALKLLNFLVNDVEASKATGTTRGVPPSTKVAEGIKPMLSADDQRATDERRRGDDGG